MRTKISNIAFIVALGTFLVPGMLQAQEGEDIPEKTETTEVIAKDTLPTSGELAVEEVKANSDVVPVGPSPMLDFTKIPASEPLLEKEEKKPAIGTVVKPKSEESQSNLSFNFIYYLFYKFKLVDSTDG